MKKRYKRLLRYGKIHILRWDTEGKLFGPDWCTIAVFDAQDANIARCVQIIKLLNECDKHTEHVDDDRKRTT